MNTTTEAPTVICPTCMVSAGKPCRGLLAGPVTTHEARAELQWVATLEALVGFGVL